MPSRIADPVASEPVVRSQRYILRQVREAGMELYTPNPREETGPEVFFVYTPGYSLDAVQDYTTTGEELPWDGLGWDLKLPDDQDLVLEALTSYNDEIDGAIPIDGRGRVGDHTVYVNAPEQHEALYREGEGGMHRAARDISTLQVGRSPAPELPHLEQHLEDEYRKVAHAVEGDVWSIDGNGLGDIVAAVLSAEEPVFQLIDGGETVFEDREEIPGEDREDGYEEWVAQVEEDRARPPREAETSLSTPSEGREKVPPKAVAETD